MRHPEFTTKDGFVALESNVRKVEIINYERIQVSGRGRKREGWAFGNAKA